jgi:hypothetical protein
MSERKGMASPVAPNRDHCDLLCDCGLDGGSGMDSKDYQPDEAWFRDSISELWCCRIPWCRFALGYLSRSIPSSVYDRCVSRVDHRKIWAEEVARNPGTFDACAKRVERRINQEVGERLLAVILPTTLVILLLTGLALGVVNLQKMEAYADVEAPQKVEKLDGRNSSTSSSFALTNPTVRSW